MSGVKPETEPSPEVVLDPTGIPVPPDAPDSFRDLVLFPLPAANTTDMSSTAPHETPAVSGNQQELTDLAPTQIEREVPDLTSEAEA